ncbi:MAG: beta-lactamase family protein [Caulobacter sp.]|nr:beta-lactamase family protein [Caulobacter sp.]
MNRRDFMTGSILLGAGLSASAAWGDDPAGDEPARVWFRRWLAVFNGDDPAAYRAFIQAHLPDALPYAEEDLATREASGGFTLLRAAMTGPSELTAWVQDRAWDRFSKVVVTTGPDDGLADIAFSVATPPEGFGIARLGEAQAVAALTGKLRVEAAADRFSGAVLAAQGDRVILREAYGQADRARRRKVQTGTRFCIGSMGKMFTAVSILQQIQFGRIRLADPVIALLPDYPNAALARRLTVEHLLTHTGGTGDIFGPFHDTHQAELRTVSDYVRLYGPREPLFEPGARFAYSNYGFVLLGAILERVAGESYEAYFEAHVFGPAGMTATGQTPRDGDALPYAGGALAGMTPLTPYTGLPAGGGYSTVDDLHAFATALREHRLLDAAHTMLATTPRVAAGGASRWGLGFRIQSRNGATCYGHGGGAPGVNGDLAIYPGSGYVTAVLSNRGHPTAVNPAEYLGNRLPS